MEEPASVAVRETGVVRGEIQSVDRFGNLVTDLVAEDLEWLGAAVGQTLIAEVEGRRVEVFPGDSIWDVNDGDWLAVVGSEGTVLMGRKYENGAATLESEAGDSVSLRVGEQQSRLLAVLGWESHPRLAKYPP